MSLVIADTGPLVALLDRDEQHHDWAVATFDGFRAPLLTCEAVVAETLYLLNTVPRCQHALLEMGAKKVLQISYSIAEEWRSIANLLARYADIPMDFSDACLVRMTELREDAIVWTLDRDFRIYRRHGRRVIPLLMPET